MGSFAAFRARTEEQFSRWAVPALAILTVVAGGATQGNAVAALVCEVGCLPLLFVALTQLMAGRQIKDFRIPLALLTAILLVPLLQLAPLPAKMWGGLPGRSDLAVGLDLAGVRAGLLSYSIMPDRTLRAWLTLLPATTMFLLVLRTEERRSRMTLSFYIFLAAASAVLGGLQLLGGDDSPLRLYRVTNREEAVGFFSNRNHQALLCAIGVPFCGYWFDRISSRLHKDKLAPVKLALVAGALVLLIIGASQTHSRAGLALLLIGLILAGLSILRRKSPGRSIKMLLVGLGAGVTAFALAAVFLMGPTLQRTLFHLNEEQPDYYRVGLAPDLAKAGLHSLPFGNGVGSFDEAYQATERLDDVSPQYLNHAHDDYLEIFMDTGLAGGALVLAFLFWYGRATFRVWTLKSGSSGMGRTASIVVGLVLIHSAVDYPIRTIAISTLFAFSVGLLVVSERVSRISRA